MSWRTANQTWVVRRGGEVVDQKAKGGVARLNEWERLLYCLWVADYMMRNAGDFANAPVMYPDFQKDAVQFAQILGLPLTQEMFSLSPHELEQAYFDRFEAVCEEIKHAESPTFRSSISFDPRPRNVN